MSKLTLYAIQPAYSGNKKYYQILPFNLKGTIICHFKYHNGFKSLIPFLRNCRLTKNSSIKLAYKLRQKDKQVAL